MAIVRKCLVDNWISLCEGNGLPSGSPIAFLEGSNPRFPLMGSLEAFSSWEPTASHANLSTIALLHGHYTVMSATYVVV